MRCQNAVRKILVENPKNINKCESMTVRCTNNLSFCGSVLLQQKQNTYSKERPPFQFILQGVLSGVCLMKVVFLIVIYSVV